MKNFDEKKNFLTKLLFINFTNKRTLPEKKEFFRRENKSFRKPLLSGKLLEKKIPKNYLFPL